MSRVLQIYYDNNTEAKESRIAKVKDGIKFILTHFEGRQQLFPRKMSTSLSQGRQFTIYNEEQILMHDNWKNKADFIGVNYYRRVFIYNSNIVDLSSARLIGGIFVNDLRFMKGSHNQPHGILNDLASFSAHQFWILDFGSPSERIGSHHIDNYDTSIPPSQFDQIISLQKCIGRTKLFKRNNLLSYGHTSLQKTLARADRIIEKSNKCMNKIRSRNAAYITRG